MVFTENTQIYNAYTLEQGNGRGLLTSAKKLTKIIQDLNSIFLTNFLLPEACSPVSVLCSSCINQVEKVANLIKRQQWAGNGHQQSTQTDRLQSNIISD